MKKPWLTIISIVIVTGLAVTAAIYYSRDVDEPEQVNTNTATQTTVKIYFDNSNQNPNATNCDAVFPVQRSVATDTQIRAAADALFAGPTNAEKSNGYVSLFSTLTAQSVQSVRVDNGVAYINLRDIRTVIPNASASCGGAQFLASIEKTMTQFNTVSNVVLAINGDPQTLYEWLQLSCPAASNNCDQDPFRL